jgi:phosphatidylinositol alpha-mannosyltransferase
LLLTVYDWIPKELQFYDGKESLKHRLHWLAAKRNLKLFDAFVVNSGFIRSFVEDQGLASVVVIPNGVTPPDLSEVEPVRLEGTPAAFFWGRLYPKKGVEPLLRAFAQAVPLYPDARLYIGGRGPCERQYRELAAQLNIAPNVVFLGFIGEHVLWGYLKACDFCILPSAYEGFGISILEAMAAGKAVITSERGGQTDFAHDYENALLVDVEDREALAGAIALLSGDAILRERLGRQGKVTAGKYTWPEIAERYIALYTSLLGRDAG